MSFAHLFLLSDKYIMSSEGAKSRQDVQDHRRGYKRKVLRKRKNNVIKRHKQLISLVLKQNKFTFYDQLMLSCYMYENSTSII